MLSTVIFLEFCNNILSEIKKCGKKTSSESKVNNNAYYLKTKNERELLENTFIKIFKSVIQKIFSLRYDEETKELLSKIQYTVENSNWSAIKEIIFNFDNFRPVYLKTFMFNTLVVPYPLIDYTKLSQVNDLLYFSPLSDYEIPLECKFLSYYPRFIHFHEIQLLKLRYPFFKNIPLDDSDYKEIWTWFYKINYGSDSHKNKSIETSDIRSSDKIKCNSIVVGEQVKCEKVRIGLANVQIKQKAFIDNVNGVSTFNAEKRIKATKLINLAISEKVDFLVMPECYVHYSWITKIIRIAKSHQIGMVFGLEHVIDWKKNIAYNYLVTILPFKLGQFTNCMIDMRLMLIPVKTHTHSG